MTPIIVNFLGHSQNLPPPLTVAAHDKHFGFIVNVPLPLPGAQQQQSNNSLSKISNPPPIFSTFSSSSTTKLHIKN